MTITSPAGRQEMRRSIENGPGYRRLGPDRSRRRSRARRGRGHGRKPHAGSTAFRVLSRAPAVRVTHAPARARVGRPVRFSFTVVDALSELAEVSTRDGTFTRRYRIRKGTGFLEWTRRRRGPRCYSRARGGREGQTASDSAKVSVAPARARPLRR